MLKHTGERHKCANLYIFFYFSFSLLVSFLLRIISLKDLIYHTNEECCSKRISSRCKVWWQLSSLSSRWGHLAKLG